MKRTLRTQPACQEVSCLSKGLKYVLFDLTVVASLVAVVHLGGREYGKALLPAPEHTVIESEYTATENEYNSTEIAGYELNREQQEGLHQLKVEVADERKHIRDELVARAAAATSSGAPLIDDGEEMLQSLTRADTLLMQIELSELVLELERLSWPLADGMRELRINLDNIESVDIGAKLVQRYLNNNEALLDKFRDKVEEFHALDGRLVGRDGELGEGYREMMDGYQILHDKFENLRRVTGESFDMEE